MRPLVCSLGLGFGLCRFTSSHLARSLSLSLSLPVALFLPHRMLVSHLFTLFSACFLDGLKISVLPLPFFFLSSSLIHPTAAVAGGKRLQGFWPRGSTPCFSGWSGARDRLSVHLGTVLRAHLSLAYSGRPGGHPGPRRSQPIWWCGGPSFWVARV